MTETKPYTKPLPNKDPLMAPFWQAAQSGQLVIQACTRCGSRHFPASPVCPDCLCDEQEWVPSAGAGRLVSFVEFHKAYWTSFAEDLPYVVCLVQLDEGPKLYSNIVGAKAEDLVVGQRLRVVFDQVTDAVTLPKFALA